MELDFEPPMDDRLVVSEKQKAEAQLCYRRNAQARTAAAEKYLQRAQRWSCLTTQSVDVAEKHSPQRVLDNLRAASMLASVEDVYENQESPKNLNSLPAPTEVEQQPEPVSEVEPAEPVLEESTPPRRATEDSFPAPPARTTLTLKAALAPKQAKPDSWFKALADSWRDVQESRVLVSTMLLIGIASFFCGLFLGTVIGS